MGGGGEGESTSRSLENALLILPTMDRVSRHTYLRLIYLYKCTRPEIPQVDRQTIYFSTNIYNAAMINNVYYQCLIN